MRVLFLSVICVIFLISNVKCSISLSFPKNLIDAVSNKTSEISHYVKDKSQHYVYNVKHKITSYFHTNYTKPKNLLGYIENSKDKIKRKFIEYLYDVKSTTEISNAITQENKHYNCTNEDPRVYLTTPQLIALNGYPSESHTVVTEDGYILTVHRIPYNRNDTARQTTHKTVLLHHGLLGSSADWVIAGPKKGLPYILSDAGYDVWLANVRGNTYSKAHISKNVDSFEFWNFTFHEVSQYDLPAVIDHIMDTKGWEVKINYIGHSMGTTVLFALLSTKPQYNKILRAGFALAPVAYMTHIKSPIHKLAPYADDIEYLLKLLGANEFLPHNVVLRWLSKFACDINHWAEAICENSFFILCGYDERQFNISLLPLILGHTPAGASTKTLVHYAQEIHNGGKFQQFDYGSKGNMKQYGSPTPPEYPLHNITLPIALLSAQNDWLAGDVDVSNLYIQLKNPIEHYIVPLKEFNHVDFLWAIDAPTLVYKKLLNLLEGGLSRSLFNVN